MEIFSLLIDVMLMMFSLILVGFIARKIKILPDNADTSIARLETYILLPALNFYNWSTNCTVITLKENMTLILYGFVIIVIAIALSYPLSKLFVKNASESAELRYERNIYKYSLAFSNYIVLGNFVVLNIFGNEGLFQYSMFTFSLTFLVNSWGIYILVPSGDKMTSADVLKKILSPPIIAMLAGGMIGLLDLTKYIPDFAVRALTNASNCMGPLAMILAGLVIGGYEMKELWNKKKVYAVTLVRLILIPVAVLSILRFGFMVDDFTLTLALMAFGLPLGLNTIVFPAAYGGDARTGASMAMVSHTLSLISIPLLYYVFIVLI